MDTEVYVYDDKIRPIDKVEFSILGNDEIKRISALRDDPNGIDIPDLYDNVEPKRGGLIDPRMGAVNTDIDCATCGLSSSKCNGHFGHIALAEPVFHYGYMQTVKRILSCICLRCSKLLIYKNENQIQEMIKNKSGRNRLNEIRNLTKNITHCQKSNYGCGTPVSKIKIEINKSYIQILLVAEIAMNPMVAESTTEDEGMDFGKKKLRQILTPTKVYDILSNISDNDCRILGIDPTKTRPEDMVQYIFPVPPVQVRPSVKADFMSASTMEDDLTHKLADIIKANIRIRKYKEAIGDVEVVMKHGADQAQLLQYHTATYFDNESLALPKSEQRSKPTKSLSARMKGKEGRIRYNLMGKRVDFSARTVITPDPSLDVNELGVPIAIAKNITFPEIVTPENIERLQKLVKNGRKKYPGANFVFPVSSHTSGRRLLPIDLRYRDGGVELRFGDVVERHIVNGDFVLLNRQPTLHKLSMMGHKVKVVEDERFATYRLNVSVTSPYNADFDGDEMNIFAPQSIQTAIELEKIGAVHRQIITPASSVPIIGVIQDSLLGSYNMTQPSMRIDWRDAMNIVSYTTIDDFKDFKKKDYKGTELFSMIIPKKISTSRKNFELKRGIINDDKGILNKSLLGSKKQNSLIHLLWDEYGETETRKFIDNVQRLVNNFNMLNGFSVGLGDIDISRDVIKKMDHLFETKKLSVNHMITELENNPDLMEADLFEQTVFAELNTIRDEVSKIVVQNMSEDNNFKILAIGSGSKGSSVNLGQMAGCVGQQALEGKRLKKSLNGRSLPYFHQNDDSAMAKGFIENSYVTGLSPTEFMFHNISSREGLIDTAIKSVTGDTPIIIDDDGEIKRVMIGEWIDNYLDNNKDLVEHYKERDMELLKLKNSVYIPTTDSKGNVSWGEITAVTRHDPGKELYKIKTHGGRSVIVTESKSLLIWNNDKMEFERMDTPLVNAGDFVPVTLSLSESSINSTSRFKCETDIDIFIKRISSGHKLDINLVNESNIVLQELIDKLIKQKSVFYPRTEYERDVFITLCSKVGYVTKIENDGSVLTSTILQGIRISNNTILDKIVSIEKVDVKLYPKVYDLTVPDTLNFGLANGLHVVDTAESGYVQRKLIKSMEDISVKYDGTVRNSNDTILQFTYGDCGIDCARQHKHSIESLLMSNDEFDKMYKFNNDELKKFKLTEDENSKYVNQLKQLRDSLRKSQQLINLNYKVFNANYMLPVNFLRIIDNTRYDDLKSSDKLDPRYITTTLENIVDYSKTKITCVSKNSMNDEDSIKLKDERVSKTIFRYALHNFLAPKRILLEYKFNKAQFDSIINQIIKGFNKAVVQPGEMVGVIAAQSIGEPVTQMTLNTFHSAGIGSKGTTALGVPRVRELLSFSRNLKTPLMEIYLNDEFKKSKTMANKIASYIKYTNISDIRNRIDVYYDPNPYKKDGFMNRDKVYNVFHSHNPGKYSCQSEINNLPWLMRIELDKEKMIEKDITLLDIKSKFCTFWEKRYQSIRTLKKDEKKLIEKVQHLAVLSNADNDSKPVIHIRFDMLNFNFGTVVKFTDVIVDNFKLKGIESVNDIYDVKKERVININDSTKSMDKDEEYVIYTKGVNLIDIRYLNGIDLNRTLCNDVVAIYEEFGIEAARSALLREVKNVIENAGNYVNYQHLSIMLDVMTSNGNLVSVDRHGINKVDTNPFARATFEKTIEQFINAAVFCESDSMRSVSSRIMSGLVIKGGTGSMGMKLDTDLLEKSEFIEEMHTYDKKSITDISQDPVINDTIEGEEKEGVFMPM